LTFREATTADLDALLALEQACYPPNQAYSREEYRYALGKAKAVNLLWEDEKGNVTGFVGAFHHRIWRLGHIYTVNVHPSERGRGLGLRLMDEAESRLRRLGMKAVVLEVNVENAAAIRLYEKGGYRLVRRLEGYYTQYRVNDAFLYEKAL
jgi:ribosomal protein S18 acetylase RimI-like enzyme